jgi:hypothetical protein
MVVNLNLDWRTGIATRDWDAITKKEKLEVSKARTCLTCQFKHFPNQITYSLLVPIFFKKNLGSSIGGLEFLKLDTTVQGIHEKLLYLKSK